MDARQWFIFLLWFVLALADAATLAGTRDPETPDEKYLEFGKKFPFVRRIRAQERAPKDPKAIHVFYGSAVMIKPHWVITAAHVLIDVDQPTILGDELDPVEYPIQHTISHPLFDDGKNGFYDLALCYSEKNLGLDFYPELYTETDELGKAATLAGFGFQGTFHTGMTEQDHKRRAGSNKISSLERSVLVCDPSKNNKTALEFLITPGDSGGGLFIGNKLAGIHSFLMAADGKPNGTYTDESAHTRVSLYANWVESQIEQYERAKQARATEGQTPILDAVQ
ncbi:trypsin-like serine protease [Sphingorhabdus sp.]|uniref:trypsin-like serine peptidase n=1 Tax=Sphingorhabdus sp. TaxID=1902408 RepID=UPI00333FA83D